MPTPIEHSFLIVSEARLPTLDRSLLETPCFSHELVAIDGKFTILSFNFNIKNRGDGLFQAHLFE